MADTLKIRLLESVAGSYYRYLKGQVVDVPGDVAVDLIRGELAELVGETAAQRAENTENRAWKRAEKR